LYFTFTFSGLAPFSPGSFIVFGFRENPVIGLLSSGPSGKYDCFGLSASPRLFGHVASCKLRSMMGNVPSIVVLSGSHLAELL